MDFDGEILRLIESREARIARIKSDEDKLKQELKIHSDAVQERAKVAFDRLDIYELLERLYRQLLPIVGPPPAEESWDGTKTKPNFYGEGKRGSWVEVRMCLGTAKRTIPNYGLGKTYLTNRYSVIVVYRDSDEIGVQGWPGPGSNSKPAHQWSRAEMEQLLVRTAAEVLRWHA